MATIHGSCLCGDVAWEAPAPLEFMSHCHCSRCRKSHGAAFATYCMAPVESLRLTRGEDAIVRYESSPEMRRPFCRRCGSVVPDRENVW
ncbi:GFA family protein, partial [Klebsiella pneumoniae]|nr:GFA family protein [Klebsiella pneumoniae]